MGASPHVYPLSLTFGPLWLSVVRSLYHVIDARGAEMVAVNDAQASEGLSLPFRPCVHYTMSAVRIVRCP